MSIDQVKSNQKKKSDERRRKSKQKQSTQGKKIIVVPSTHNAIMILSGLKCDRVYPYCWSCPSSNQTTQLSTLVSTRAETCSAWQMYQFAKL